MVGRIKPPTQEDRYSLDLPNAFLNGLFQGALVHGISAAFPPVAPFLLPVYDLFNYGKFGINLLKLNKELSNNSTKKEIKKALRKTAEAQGDITSQPIADIIAGALVSAAQDIGLITSIAKITSMEEKVYTQMLEGSISNGISNGVGNLTAYSVGLF